MSEQISKKVENSSNIEQVDYDGNTLVLTVHFKNGGKYQYAGVPPGIFEKFTEAESLGSFFHKNIRSKYDSKKL